MKTNILVVDDDKSIRNLIKFMGEKFRQNVMVIKLVLILNYLRKNLKNS